MNRDDLEKLSKPELVELVLKMQRPAKTSQTSSKPPSTDRKARRKNAKPGGAKPGHKGHFRELHANPDTVIDHRPEQCPHCQRLLEADLLGDVIGEYDAIDLPSIKPIVERHRRLAVTCPHCQARGESAVAGRSSGFALRARD